MTQLCEIRICPIKGFSTVELSDANLRVGEGIKNDRRFGITNNILNTLDGDWLTFRSFFINSVCDGLQRFKLTINPQGEIEFLSPQQKQLTFHPDKLETIELCNREIADFVAPLDPKLDFAPPQIVERNQVEGTPCGYWDYPNTGLSIINLATVRAISEVAGKKLDHRRFRGNLMIDGIEAWQEISLVGKRFSLGEAEIEIIRPINRCPATSVNPDTANRDIPVPNILQQSFGHVYCGVYANVVKAGQIKPEDQLLEIGEAKTTLAEACDHGAPAHALWPKIAKVQTYRIGGDTTEIGLISASPWPLTQAQTGQKMRLHMGTDLWTSAEITGTKMGGVTISVSDSPTDDPATNHLRNNLKAGQKTLVSGPFGRVNST